MTNVFAVVRVRGGMETRGKVEGTLRQLHLRRKQECVFVKESGALKGMLLLAKDFITWGEINSQTCEQLIAQRAKVAGDKPLTDEYVSKNSSFKSVKEFAQAVAEGKGAFKDVKGLKPLLRLAPPRQGFGGSIKRAFPEGALGYRGDNINELLQRML